MKNSSDFRRIAREALSGRWVIATLTAFIAALIGASSDGAVSFNYDADFDKLSETLNGPLAQFFLKYGNLIILVTSVLAIVYLIIGGAGILGYSRFNLNLVDEREARVGDLFSQYNRIGTGIIMSLLISLYIFLWSMLFVIPGIVKSYSYSMTGYILLEHPEYSVNYAITESRRMMDGNKFRLFCLRLSFIGWTLLCSFVAAIGLVGIIGGSMWFGLLLVVALIGGYAVTAYMRAAEAAFYREISGTEIPANMYFVNPETN